MLFQSAEIFLQVGRSLDAVSWGWHWDDLYAVLVVSEGDIPATRLVRLMREGAVGGAMDVCSSMSICWGIGCLCLLSLLHFNLLSLGNLPYLLGLLVSWDRLWVFWLWHKAV